MPAPEDILAVWFAPPKEAWRDRWFEGDDAFDAMLRERFATTLDVARAGALDGWADTPRGALALVIVLDQLPRNLHRGRAEAFAADAKARVVADAAIARQFDRQLTPVERLFLYLPFEHSEAIADQERSIRLCEMLRDDPHIENALAYAQRHHDVIRRFGRFPHRNAALGRDSTTDELAFLAQNPDGF